MQANLEYSHRNLVEREIKAVGVVMVTYRQGFVRLNTNITRVTLGVERVRETASLCKRPLSATRAWGKRTAFAKLVSEEVTGATSRNWTACWARSRCS